MVQGKDERILGGYLQGSASKEKLSTAAGLSGNWMSGMHAVIYSHKTKPTDKAQVKMG